MPLRMKEVHIVRQPFLFNMVWPMFKQFVGDKLKKRVCITILGIRFIIYNILRHGRAQFGQFIVSVCIILGLLGDTFRVFEKILLSYKSITFSCR